MKLSKYERDALKEIRVWERQEHKGFHKKLLDVTSKPVDYLLRKAGAEKLASFERAIENTVKTFLGASGQTVNPEDLIRRAHEYGITIKDLSELRTCNLELLDECNRKNIDFHEKAGAIQGAAAGLGGVLTATVDLTALLVQDLHMLQEIAFCYGFDPNEAIEKEIILRIVEIGIGGSEIKFKAIKEIELLKKTKAEEGKDNTTKKGVAVLGAKALEESVEHLMAALLVRLVPRALPIISVAVSAHSNHEIMEHSGSAAFMVYRKRFIERKRQL